MDRVAVEQKFLLEQDAVEQRQWSVWINGIEIRQSNETNPRIAQIDIGKQLSLSNVVDRLVGLSYEVRIVKAGIDPALIQTSQTWELSFDGGLTKYSARPVGAVRESKNQGVAWIVHLELGRGNV